MSRHALSVRDARPEDAAALMDLWVRAGNTSSEVQRPATEVSATLAHVAASPDERLLVAVLGGDVVGTLHLRRSPISPLHTESAVHTTFLVVDPEQRKHGVGRALLEGAVEWAEEKDIAHITAITTSASRETNRWLARFGFSTLATMRVTSTTSLRLKIRPEPIRTPAAQRNLGRVLAQRRFQRRAMTAMEPVEKA